MTLGGFEEQVARTQGRHGRIEELVLSLLDEAQEAVCGLNAWRDAPSEDYDLVEQAKLDFLQELGDVFNVLAACAMHAGSSLEELARLNREKMLARMPECFVGVPNA